MPAPASLLLEHHFVRVVLPAAGCRARQDAQPPAEAAAPAPGQLQAAGRPCLPSPPPPVAVLGQGGPRRVLLAVLCPGMLTSKQDWRMQVPVLPDRQLNNN